MNTKRFLKIAIALIICSFLSGKISADDTLPLRIFNWTNDSYSIQSFDSNCGGIKSGPIAKNTWKDFHFDVFNEGDCGDEATIDHIRIIRDRDNKEAMVKVYRYGASKYAEQTYNQMKEYYISGKYIHSGMAEEPGPDHVEILITNPP